MNVIIDSNIEFWEICDFQLLPKSDSLFIEELSSFSTFMNLLQLKNYISG